MSAIMALSPFIFPRTCNAYVRIRVDTNDVGEREADEFSALLLCDVIDDPTFEQHE